MIYLDTNILVYAFCKNVDDEIQKQKAQEILKESIISKQLVLSEISLYEFAFICKKLKEELEVINDNIDFLSRYIKNKKIYSEVLQFIKYSLLKKKKAISNLLIAIISFLLIVLNVIN